MATVSKYIELYENHGAKVKKSRHTFRKVAKFTANSRSYIALKNVSLTNKIFMVGPRGGHGAPPLNTPQLLSKYMNDFGKNL